MHADSHLYFTHSAIDWCMIEENIEKSIKLAIKNSSQSHLTDAN